MTPSAIALFVRMSGRKLRDVREDEDVYNLVWRKMILEDMATNPSDIITECHLNYDNQDKYPGMQHEDWDRVVMNFVRDIQACYDLTLPEIFSLSA